MLCSNKIIIFITKSITNTFSFSLLIYLKCSSTHIACKNIMKCTGIFQPHLHWALARTGRSGGSGSSGSFG